MISEYLTKNKMVSDFVSTLYKVQLNTNYPVQILTITILTTCRWMEQKSWPKN